MLRQSGLQDHVGATPVWVPEPLDSALEASSFYVCLLPMNLEAVKSALQAVVHQSVKRGEQLFNSRSTAIRRQSRSNQVGRKWLNGEAWSCFTCWR